MTGRRPWLARSLELLRAGLAGAVATAADEATLVLLVAAFHVDPRAANAPALVVGGVANFVGNRRFAFRDGRHESVAAQAAGYAIVELVALALNGLLFDRALTLFGPHAPPYWAVRLATSHLVFLVWSYPLWRRVFAPRTVPT
jgi:putative flippase GtrA